MVAQQMNANGKNLPDIVSEESIHRFVLRPNQSMSWRGNLLFLSGLFGIFLVTGVAFTLMGLWLVLPFAGLDLVLVAWALYKVSKSCQVCEVISIDEQSVTIERGRRWPESSDVFQRTWAQFQLQRSRSRLHPSRLVLVSHGQAIEVGSFLTEEERNELAGDLAKHIRLV